MHRFSDHRLSELVLCDLRIKNKRSEINWVSKAPLSYCGWDDNQLGMTVLVWFVTTIKVTWPLAERIQHIGPFKFPIQYMVCYSLQIFNFDDFCIFYEIFIRPITVFVYKNPEMTRERLELSYCLKIWFYCLILRYKAKIASWFGSVGRNRARKSPKNEIFWFGQKIWLGYPLGQPKIIKL